MARLFISHSSRDNVYALAFRNWLVANGWDQDDVFIDLHDIGAGQRWRDTLRKANAACEAVILLASPNSLGSVECQKELELAEALGKEIILAILHGLKRSDPLLVRYRDRQFVDLSAFPQEYTEALIWQGQEHHIGFNNEALSKIKVRLDELGIAPGTFPWPPKGVTQPEPYPGLAAFKEEDAGIFFGREADTAAGLARLKLMRKRRSPRLLVIQAASGAGKSSFLRAGLWPRLTRDPDFAPLAILRPALGIMTGPDEVGRKFAPFFQRHGRTKVPGNISADLAKGGLQAFAALIAEAASLSSKARRASAPDARAPAPLLAIDQGEEMFAAENAFESQWFLEMLAEFLREPPPDVDPYVLITIRADSVETLLQRWPALGLEAPETQVLPPLSPTAYRDVIIKPAELYSLRLRRLAIEPELVAKLVQEASGADALPLLAFTLEKLFFEFGGDGKLTAEHYNSMGGIGGSIDRALAEAQRKAGAGGSADNLRRLIIPGLATWDPAASGAKRLVAKEAELNGGERKSLAPLANALVEARLLTRNRDTLEVAHEALLRRPPIAGWLEQQKDALKLRDDVLREAKEWESGGNQADFVRRGARLEAALNLAKQPDYAALLSIAQDYLHAGLKLEKARKWRARFFLASIFALMGGIIAVQFKHIYAHQLYSLWFKLLNASPVSNQTALGISVGRPFWDCAKSEADYSRHCPAMVVVPAGSFMMGSPDSDKDAWPQRASPTQGEFTNTDRGSDARCYLRPI